MTATQIAIPNTNAIDEEFEHLLAQCGAPIGMGTTRDAYRIPSHLDKVLKVSKVPSHMTNWAEAVIYHYVDDKSFFGEVLSWSRSGKYLVMERLDDVLASEISGLEVPHWWNDKKTSNLGRSLSGNLKIRDYAMLNIQPGVLFRFP